ncbi:MAG: hypothetical protein EZS28_041287, partial [Streblomastix strix]
MDDIVILSKSKHTLETSTLQIVQFLRDLGWRISLRKCQIFPRTVFQYLGWMFNSIDMAVSMPHQRKRQMKGKLDEWIMKTKMKQIVKVKELASLIGEINFLRFQFTTISLYMNALQAMKTKAVIKRGWSSRFRMNLTVKINLEAIYQMISNSILGIIMELTQDTIIITDAQESAWGAEIQQSTRDSSRLDGPSNVSNITLPAINNLHPPSNRQFNNGVQSSEMEGFFQPDSSDKKDCGIDLRNECPADNGPYTWNRKLVSGCSQQDVMEGRLQNSFATRTTKQCPRYFSPLEDRRAEARDAFSVPWTGEAMLIHPPVEQILRAINKAKRDGVIALVILPDWTLKKYIQNFPTIIAALNLGLTS